MNELNSSQITITPAMEEHAILDACIKKNLILNTKPDFNSVIECEVLSRKIAPHLYIMSKSNPCNYLHYIRCFVHRPTFILDNKYDKSSYANALYINSIRFIPRAHLPYNIDFINDIKLILKSTLTLLNRDVSITSSLLKSMIYLIRHYGKDLDSDTLFIVLQHMATFFQSHCNNISKLSRDVATSIIYHLSQDKKEYILCDQLMNLPYTKSTYILIVCLLNNMVLSNLTLEQRNLLLKGIFRALHCNQFAYDGGNIFELLIRDLSFCKFYQSILPTIIEWCSLDDETLLSSNIKSFIINKCVTVFRRRFYSAIRFKNIAYSIKAHALHVSIKKGYCNPEFYLNDIKYFLYIGDMNVKVLAFHCMCDYSKAQEVISAERLNLIYECFNSDFIREYNVNNKKSFSVFMNNFWCCFCTILKLYKHAKLIKVLNVYYDFFKNLINLIIVKLNLYVEDSLSVAKLILEVFHITLGNKETLDYIAHKELKNAFSNLYDESMYRCVQTLINKLEKSTEYYEDTVNIFSHLITFITAEEISTLKSTLSILLYSPSYTSLKKCKVILDMLIAIHKKYLTEMDDVVEFVMAFIERDLQLTNFDEKRLHYSSIYNGLTCWKVILEECNFVNIKTPALSIYEYLSNLISRILKYIAVEFPIGDDKKNIEQIIISTIEVMYTTIIKGKLEFDQMKEFIELAESIISYSNMKRPVTTTKHYHNSILKLMSKNTKYFDQFMDKKLHNALTVNVHNQMIRRRPEASLIIESFALCDQNYNHYMNKTIKFVRNFLYQHCNQTGPSTVAALFSMESLFANKSMVYETLQYEADLMILSIELFNENDFAIKNAASQLIQTLTIRMLGQSCGTAGFKITSQEYFINYPKLTKYMLQVLLNPLNENSDDKILIVLMLLINVTSNKNCITTNNIIRVHKCFVNLLKNLIMHKNHKISGLACDAFTSLIEVEDIPDTIINIIDYLCTELSNIPKNVLANVLQLIQHLKSKYYVITENKKHMANMESVIYTLLNCMKSVGMHPYYMTLLNIQLTNWEILYEEYKQIILRTDFEPLEKITLCNILSYLIEHSNIYEFSLILKVTLDSENITAQELCLRSTMEKTTISSCTSEYVHFQQMFNSIIKYILLRHETPEYSHIMELVSYTLLTITNHIPLQVDEDIYSFVCNQFEIQTNHYNTFEVYLIVLYKTDTLTMGNMLFTDWLLSIALESLPLTTLQRRRVISNLLIYFHRCITIASRPILLTVATYLLLEDDLIDESVYRYFSLAFGMQENDQILALNTILDPTVLCAYFCNSDAVKEFYFTWLFKLLRSIVNVNNPLGFYPVNNSEYKKLVLLGGIFKYFCRYFTFPSVEYVEVLNDVI